MSEFKTVKDIVSWTCECNCVTFDEEVCRACGKSSSKYGNIDFDNLREIGIKRYKHHTNRMSEIARNIAVCHRGIKLNDKNLKYHEDCLDRESRLLHIFEGKCQEIAEFFDLMKEEAEE